MTDVPVAVAINEAVELAKLFGGENSSRLASEAVGVGHEEESLSTVRGTNGRRR